MHWGDGKFQEANYLQFTLLFITTLFSAFSVVYMPYNIQQFSTRKPYIGVPSISHISIGVLNLPF
jgi:hypothetical protein